MVTTGDKVMDVTCSSCKTKLTIPDEKIPKGKKSSLLCPKCKTRISIDPAPEAVQETAVYDAADKPFDFLEETANTALLCTGEKAFNTTIERTLLHMGYYTTVADNVRTALTNMKYHLFNIVVIDEGFDKLRGGADKVLDYLRRLEMASRRKLFVLLISETYRTMDNMAAFHLSVDMIINAGNMTEFDKILVPSVKKHDLFYKVFSESMKAVGKA